MLELHYEYIVEGNMAVTYELDMHCSRMIQIGLSLLGLVLGFME